MQTLMDNSSKREELKLDEMKFQYQLIENNYARLIDKCSFSMLFLCIILGVVASGDSETSLNCLSQIMLSFAVISTIISLGFLCWILVCKKQPLVRHGQIVEDNSDYGSITRKLVGSYSDSLRRLKLDITKSQNHYRTSLAFLILSVVCVCANFFIEIFDIAT